MANNTVGLIAFWGYIPKQTYLVEFSSVHFLERRFSLVKNNFSATSHQKTSLTIISLFSCLFQCYSIQHKKMQINIMEILRLKHATFVKSLTSFGPQFHYLYNYRGGLGDFEGLWPTMVCNYLTIQFDKRILFIPSKSSALEGKLGNMPLFTRAFKSKMGWTHSPPEVLHLYLCCTFVKTHSSSIRKEQVVFIWTPK